MREGWEYKKLGDYIHEISLRNKLNEEIPVYSVTNSLGFCKDYFGKEVASKDKTTYKIVPYGCFAYNPSRINVGSIDWQAKEDRVVVSPLYNVFEVSDDIIRDYLLFYLKSPQTIKAIDVVATGTVRSNLRMSMLSQFELPVPPLAEQQRIVAEFDLLTSIIDKQKAQLKELDTLAQSIFYDMFGDPVENEKGWEVKKLREICTKITDGTHDTPVRLEKGVPFITGKHISPYCIDYGHSDFVSIEDHNEIFARCNPQRGDVLYTNIGAGMGNAALNTVDYEFSMKNVALLKVGKNINGHYLVYYLNSLRVKEHILSSMGAGGAQKFLSLKIIGQIKTNTPPLSLQQSFAAKIEAIEKQKAAISKSIAESQQLFDYTMDKYFG